MLPFVWPEWIKLKINLNEVKENGSNRFLKTLAKLALVAMERKDKEGIITKVHRIATFLHPAFRKLEHVCQSEEERQEVGSF